MDTVELIPVSEWIYDLYQVEFWMDDPTAGGTPRRIRYFAASDSNQMMSDANDYADSINAVWIMPKRIKENIGHPNVVGSILGLPMYESSLQHGERLFEKLKDTLKDKL